LCAGAGGKFCELEALTLGGQIYLLRSAIDNNQGVGVESSGDPAAPATVQHGPRAHFTIIH
jgi:hypothetical protein